MQTWFILVRPLSKFFPRWYILYIVIDCLHRWNLVNSIQWFFSKDKVYIDRQGCRRVQVSHSDVGGNEGFYVWWVYTDEIDLYAIIKIKLKKWLNHVPLGKTIDNHSIHYKDKIHKIFSIRNTTHHYD